MNRVKTLAWAVTVALIGAGNASAGSLTLTGTIYDFCAPSIAGQCTQLSDFEGSIPGVTTNMTGTTLVGGVPVAGPNIVAGASTAANFAKWYVDSPGYNQSAPFALTLTEGTPGVYSYSSTEFFPIDNQLYGNQDREHNYHFTLHLTGLLSFTDPTPGVADSFFTFTGDDDLWIFVNGQRFMDIGGVHGPSSGTFTEEDLLAGGLLPNSQYAFDMFFAERHTVLSNLTITTSLALQESTVPEPTSVLLLLTGLGGVAAKVRSRRK